MIHLNSALPRLGLIAYLLAAPTHVFAAETEAAVSLNAVIAKASLGCEITLTENVMSFKPLQSKQLTGSPKAYEIKPLQLQLNCIDQHSAILPKLTIEGETPYAEDTKQTIFLNGTPNGIGFMVRQSEDDNPIGLGEFYQTDAAIGNGGSGTPLTILNEANQYQSEPVLWVGLVGPFQPKVIPGNFHASLTLNVAFE